MITKNFLISVSLTALAAIIGINTPIVLANNQKISVDKRRVVEHWTPDRMATAIPRDLVIDERGLGYLRKPNNSLQPYGHSIAAQVTETPRGKPSGSSDSTPPSVSDMMPADGNTIGETQLFSATITDVSGIKSVSFVITFPNYTTTQSFSPAFVGNDKWDINLQGFTDGNWSWHVVAKDGARGGGNTRISDSNSFTVNTDGSSGDGGSGDASYIITNSEWLAGGDIQTAAGRIYFEMPSNPKWKRWSGYVCSGTVATDETTGRSVIITAAHCVYDDANKAFARNVLFIPNQAATTGSRTDSNCDNDPLGCWVPSFGVVDNEWTTRTFPDNIEWDYAYYVVDDYDAHNGTASSDILDIAAQSFSINFDTTVYIDDGDPTKESIDFTHALGYSYSDDPKFMYCAEDMTTEGAVNWWLPSCALSGGSSGGPWVQPMDVESGSGGPIISVNSWGYTTSPGMAGPKLNNTLAPCLFIYAKNTKFSAVSNSEGEAGIAVVGCD